MNGRRGDREVMHVVARLRVRRRRRREKRRLWRGKDAGLVYGNETWGAGIKVRALVFWLARETGRFLGVLKPYALFGLGEKVGEE